MADDYSILHVTPAKAKTPRKFLARLLAGLSLTLGVLGLLGGALAVAMLYLGGEWSRTLGYAILEISLPFALGAILLGHWSRFRPGYLCGYAWLVPLLLAPIAQGLSRKRPTAPPSPLGALHTILTAEMTYASTYNNGYSPTLGCLGPPPVGQPTAMNAGLIDDVLAGTGYTSEKNGYRFVYAPGPRDAKGRINSYSITASPTQPGVTGTNYYYTDQTGVIRQNSTAPATVADSPIAG